MTELNSPFTPDWVCPPGESILDLIEERGWSQGELAVRLGFSEKHISQLINGKVPLTTEVAMRLERVLGSTIDFWLSLEANYQKHLARLKATEDHTQWDSWLDELPIKELMHNGVLRKRRLVSTERPKIVNDCLSFFGVATPEEWREHYGEMQMAFRRTKDEQCDVGAISSWLRLGEITAEKIDVPKYDKVLFEHAMTDIRGMTNQSPEDFLPLMIDKLNKAGVVFALVPAIPRAHVSGVARWLSPTRPLIQLSLYGKTNDKFWFTFFHEAAHILLHSKDREQKKSIFLDDPNSVAVNDPKEHEANEWAGNVLIPEEYRYLLVDLKSKSQVMDFAKHINIHPGVVVGRLQHDKIIESSWMNSLKVSFKFAE